MQSFYSHIRYLLFRYGCVILPGFGAFMLHKIPATITKDKLSIIPPTFLITFNQAIAVDDGLLTGSYARKLGITFVESGQLVRNLITGMKKELAEKSFLKISHIGSFKMEENHNFVFTPEERQIKNSAVLGLRQIELKKFKDLKIKEKDLIKDNKVLEKDSRYYYFKIRKNTLKAVAIFLTLICIASSVFITPEAANYKEEKASVIPFELLIKAPLNGKTDKKDCFNGNEPKNSSNLIGNQTSPNLNYLIVATFESEKEANKFVNLHSNYEFPLYIVNSKRLSRVAIASAYEKEELRSLQKTEYIRNNFPESWIWSSNN